MKGFVVQKSRVLDSMKRVEIEGVLQGKMLLKPILRRQYNVRAPLSLWHMDGYHKLIRIERLWRDVWDGCIGLFYKLFCMMEDTGILLPQNDDHLKALHYIYLPRIQQHIGYIPQRIHQETLENCKQQDTNAALDIRVTD
ncbi:hypothetical protein MAR_013718 [Mya arenaria]|uniref:Integrase core domain-containing protein n=1 Tax=Mya arenaria TaxID=6604 RepID=A0ABY7G3Q3_MYAAR|nr:hypothetical protein MAR_013718 [Mya arenaria]